MIGCISSQAGSLQFLINLLTMWRVPPGTSSGPIPLKLCSLLHDGHYIFFSYLDSYPKTVFHVPMETTL